MYHCREYFTPADNPKLHRPEMGHRVCRMDACVSMQNSIDSGDSDMPPWHPDYDDPTEDEDYLRLASTDDQAIADEKLREATTEAQRQRRARLPPDERRIAEERLTGKSYPENQVIVNYDDEVVAYFETPGARTQAFQLAEHKHELLKSQFDKKIKERLNKRSG